MKLESEKCCCWTISIYFFYSFFKTITNCFKGLPTAVTVIENGSNVALVCMMIVAILSIIRKVDRRTILFLFVVALLLVLNILIYETVPPRYSEYMRTFIIVCIPLAILIQYVNQEYFVRLMEGVGIVIGFLFLLIVVFEFGGYIRIGVYNTSLGYSVLFPEICVIRSLNSRRGWKKYTAVISLVSFFVAVLLFGSRGPIVSIIIFCLYDYLQRIQHESDGTKKTVKEIVSVLFLLIAFLNFSTIMNWIYTALTNAGINSRTLKLMATEMGHLSGRDDKYSVVIGEIIAHPFRIRGIAGDTLITGGSYSHNFILELLCEFGILFGGIFVLWIGYRAIKDVFFSDYDCCKIPIMLMFSSVPSLLFSSTIWMHCVFWMWVMSSDKLSDKHKVVIE